MTVMLSTGSDVDETRLGRSEYPIRVGLAHTFFPCCQHLLSRKVFMAVVNHPSFSNFRHRGLRNCRHFKDLHPQIDLVQLHLILSNIWWYGCAVKP